MGENLMFKPPDAVFTQEEQGALVQWGANISKSKFNLGWLIAESIESHQAENSDVTAADVYHIAARFSGGTERTLRYYTEIARHFDPGFVDRMTDKYPNLSFSHYAIARKRKYGSDDLGYRYLRYAGEKLMGPEAAERRFDIEHKIDGAKEERADLDIESVRSWYHKVIRDHTGSPDLPMKYARRAVKIWRDLKSLLDDIRG